MRAYAFFINETKTANCTKENALKDARKQKSKTKPFKYPLAATLNAFNLGPDTYLGAKVVQWGRPRWAVR